MTVAVFLDRDGVINENRADHVMHPDEVHLVPGALGALALLAKAQVPCYVVTNQAAVGRGLLSEQVLAAIHQRISDAVGRAGGAIAGFYHCPHTPAERCACRKPRPGLLEQAAAEHDLVLARCYLIGDALTDIQAAQAVGCTPILVRTGRGYPQLLHDDARHVRDYYVAAHLQQAVRWIIRHEQRARQHDGARRVPALMSAWRSSQLKRV